MGRLILTPGHIVDDDGNMTYRFCILQRAFKKVVIDNNNLA